MTRRGLIIACLVCGACDGDKGPTGPPGPAPTVELTKTFDDAPVSGAVLIEPGEDLEWRFEVDLDGDGDPEARGKVDEVVQVPYSFEAVGPHRVIVTLERGSEIVVEQRFVVVNDPDGFHVEGVVEVGDPMGGLSESIVEGIATDGSTVFASKSTDSKIILLDAMTLAILDTIAFQSLATLEGLSLTPDGGSLYVMTKNFELRVITLPNGEIASSQLVEGRFFVQAISGQRAYVGGNTSAMALVDTATGTTIRRFSLENSGPFAVARNESEVAVLDRFLREPVGGLVYLLSSGDLSVKWVTDLGQATGGVPEAIAMPEGRSKLYVLYTGGGPSDTCGLVVLDQTSGSIIRDFPLGDDCTPSFGLGVANPSAVAPDGRFAVFPTNRGAYFVDTDLDLPVYRTPQPNRNFCCDVAVSPSEDVFYFASRAATVTKVRVVR